MSYLTSFLTLIIATATYYLFKHICTGGVVVENWEPICFILVWQLTWLRIAVSEFEDKFIVAISYAKVLSNKHLGKLSQKDFEFASQNDTTGV
jgi:hypothetical protein